MIDRRHALGVGTVSAVLWPHVAFASEPKIKIGQIGTKHPHAAGKLATIRKLSDRYELVGVVEPDDEQWNRVKMRREYSGVLRLTEDQLLGDGEVAAVAVETGVKQLVPTAIRCVRHGKHIHLDKPAGESLSDFQRLLELSAKESRTVQMGYMLRYNPAFEFLKSVVDQGWLGVITEIDAAMGKKANAATREELSEFKGGGMFELACHLIDATISLFGSPDRVTGYARRIVGDGLLDNQLAVMEYPTALATIRCNHVDPFGFPRRFFRVVGTEGNVLINPLEPPAVQLSLASARGQYKKGAQAVQLRESTGRYDDEFRDLARVIRGEKKLAWDAKHDLAVHQAILLASKVT